MLKKTNNHYNVKETVTKKVTHFDLVCWKIDGNIYIQTTLYQWRNFFSPLSQQCYEVKN